MFTFWLTEKLFFIFDLFFGFMQFLQIITEIWRRELIMKCWKKRTIKWSIISQAKFKH